VAEAARVKTVATTSLRIIFDSPYFSGRARRVRQASPTQLGIGSFVAVCPDSLVVIVA
jgi:hypothetical protein